DNVERKLVEFLGDPQTCPHGHPIPPRDLSDPVRIGIPLAQLESASYATVHGVTDEVPEILRYLGEIGLRPGTKVTVQEKAPLGGPITIEVNGRTYPISLELARMVIVNRNGESESIV